MLRRKIEWNPCWTYSSTISFDAAKACRGRRHERRDGVRPQGFAGAPDRLDGACDGSRRREWAAARRGGLRARRATSTGGSSCALQNERISSDSRERFEAMTNCRSLPVPR